MALDIITSINLDMKAPNAEVVYGNQYDTVGYVVAQLLNDGEKWSVPSGSKSVVSYMKTDRIGGYYDTTTINETAVTFPTSDRSKVRIALDEQTLTTVGNVKIQVSFYQNDKRLSTFSFILNVKSSPITATNIDSKWFGNLLLMSGVAVDETLTIAGAAADAKKAGEKVNKPKTSPNGTSGQILSTNGDGTTQWVNHIMPTDEQVENAVSDWLDDHPEATTTVEDGSITKQKLATELSNLTTDVETLLDDTIVAFLHQDDAYCVDPTTGYSSCTVIFNSETCIIYDLGHDNATKVVSFLSQNNISKVDAVIISHYHEDHCSEDSFDAFIENCGESSIDLSDCVWYLPHNDIDWSEFTGTTYDDVETYVKNGIESNNMTYVQPSIEGQKVTIGKLTIEFYNVTAAYYSDYYDWLYNESNKIAETPKTNYNNFSMCSMVTISGHKLFLTGDIMLPSQDNMAHIVKSADCLLVPHHGLNCAESKKFIRNMNCRLSVVAGFYTERYEVIQYALRPIPSRCRELGTVLSTLGSDVLISFSEAEMHVLTTSDIEVTGEAVGQMLFDDDDLDDIGYGVFYTDSAARSSNITNWPVLFGSQLGAAKIYSIPSNSTSRQASGTVQVAIATFDRNAKMCYRKKESGAWSDWRAVDSYALFKNTNYELNVFGWVTNDGKDVVLCAPIAIQTVNTRAVTSIVSSISLGVRLPTGGYVGGANAFDATSYINKVDLESAGRGLVITLRKSDGWDLTNNICVSGLATIRLSEDLI